MCIKNDRMSRARNFPFTVNRRRRVSGFAFEQLGMQSAPLHHLANEFSIAADVVSIGSDVRKREKTRELFEDLSLMRAAIIADSRLRSRSDRRQRDKQTEIAADERGFTQIRKTDHLSW